MKLWRVTCVLARFSIRARSVARATSCEDTAGVSRFVVASDRAGAEEESGGTRISWAAVTDVPLGAPEAQVGAAPTGRARPFRARREVLAGPAGSRFRDAKSTAPRRRPQSARRRMMSRSRSDWAAPSSGSIASSRERRGHGGKGGKSGAGTLPFAFVLAPLQKAANGADIRVDGRLLQSTAPLAAVFEEVHREGLHRPARELGQLGDPVSGTKGEDVVQRIAVAAGDGGFGEPASAAGH